MSFYRSYGDDDEETVSAPKRNPAIVMSSSAAAVAAISLTPLRLSSLTIEGVSVDFPYSPYTVQLDYMSAVIRCLSSANSNAILESPTGTGKTLCLLCAAIAWQQQQPPQARPTIIYSSRTHSQLAQVARELKKTKYSHVSAISVGSREQLCVNPQYANQRGDMLHASCRTAVKQKTCQYFVGTNTLKMSGASSGILSPSPVLDIEDLRTVGERNCVCPFFYSREQASQASVVFVPYNYLFQPGAVKSLGVELKDAVVIIDEAHNIGRVCEEAASVEFGHLEAEQVNTEAEALLSSVFERIRDPVDSLAPDEEHNSESSKKKSSGEQNDEFLEDQLVSLKRCVLEVESALALPNLPSKCDATGRPEKEFNFDEVCEFLVDSGIEKFSQALSADVITKILNFASSLPAELRTSTVAIERFERTIETLRSARADGKERFTGNFKVFLTEGDPRQTAVSNLRVLSLYCCSPSVAMRSLIEKRAVRNLIITSGTLSPLHELKSSLEIPFSVELQNSHVIGPGQLIGGVALKGPQGNSLNCSYKNRDVEAYLADLGGLLANTVRGVPGGILMAFPSYQQLEKTTFVWRKLGIYERVLSFKPIFIEPRLQSESAEVLSRFIESCSTSSGAVLLCVCRGKIAEGMDLADSMCRLVIVVGLPFPALMEKKVVLKRNVLDAKSPGAGSRWYSTEAMRAVNQVLGRVIRHKDDYGAVILADERFLGFRDDLPGWVKQDLKVWESFGSLVKEVNAFFAPRREAHIKLEGKVDSETDFEKLKARMIKPDHVYKHVDVESIKNMFKFGNKMLIQCKPAMVGSAVGSAVQPAKQTVCSDQINSSQRVKHESKENSWIVSAKSSLTPLGYSELKTALKQLKEDILADSDSHGTLEKIAELLVPHDLHDGLVKLLPERLRRSWDQICHHQLRKRVKLE